MNMLEKHKRPSNHRSEKGMNIVDIDMVDVKDMDIVEERTSNVW
jgi:hypothetical protein